MRKRVRHIVFFLALVLSMASCQRPRGIISRDDMTRILEDMLVADYWISLQTAEIRQQADTTRFYEPIFAKYGYTLENYLASVDYYMNDPERFARMAKKAKKSIDAHSDRLQAEIDAEAESEEAAEMELDNAEPEPIDIPLDTASLPLERKVLSRKPGRL